MFKPRRYTDITEQRETAERVRAHAPLREELAARGFAPFCVMEAGPYAPMCWSVLVDEGARTAASILIGRRTGAGVYLVTHFADGTVIETQWRPKLPSVMEIGPSAWMDDRPAKLIRTLSARTVEDVIATHATVLRAHDQAAHEPWTVATYLRFRRQSWTLMEGNRAVRDFVAAWFTIACAVATLGLLAVRWPGWIVAVAACATFVIATRVVLWQLGVWIGGAAVRLVPVEARARLAARLDEAGWDDE